MVGSLLRGDQAAGPPSMPGAGGQAGSRPGPGQQPGVPVQQGLCVVAAPLPQPLLVPSCPQAAEAQPRSDRNATAQPVSWPCPVSVPGHGQATRGLEVLGWGPGEAGRVASPG